MSLWRSWAVAKQDLRLVAREPVPFLLATVMPLILMAFIKPAARASVLSPVNPHLNGAEQAVPGMTVMFGFLLAGAAGFNVFREHGWNTWNRLRTSHCTTTELLLGKATAPVLMIATSGAVVLSVGSVLFDLRIRGSLWLLALTAASLVLCATTFTFMCVARSRSVSHLNAFANIGALLFAGLGGALTPVNVMPDWAQTVAPVVPSYWLMRASNNVIIDGAGFAETLPSLGVVLLFSTGFLIIASTGFKVSQRKASWV